MSKIKTKESTPSSSVDTYSVLTTGTTLRGDINTEEDFRIDGTIEGNIVCKGKIIVGQNSSVKGNIECVNIELMGQVTGNITCFESIILRSACLLTGDIETKVVEIEPGAKFIGSCSMVNK